MTFRGKDGKVYNTVEPAIGKGGEGTVYRINGVPNCVLKVFNDNNRTESRHRKLLAMINSPLPSDAMQQVTWPMDIVYDNGQFTGYVMPAINNNEDLNVMYSDKYSCTLLEKITIAKNLCSAINAVHNAGQVCGDLNPKNISVDPRHAIVTLLDTDSYHITDPRDSKIYRCIVGLPEYLPKEIQIKMKNGMNLENASLPTFTKYSDLFALAVHIFALLMNGCHPFACAVNNSMNMGALANSQPSVVAPQPIENICNDFFPFANPKAGITTPQYAPDFGALPADIQNLFLRAFVRGGQNPLERPDAVEWYNALTNMQNNLKTCAVDSRHMYAKHLSDCPWCKVNKKIQSISNNSSHSSMGGTILQQASFSGFPQQFALGSYKYTPSSSTSGSQVTTQKYDGRLAAAFSVIIAFICVFSFFHFYLGNADSPIGSYILESITNDGKTETAEDYERIAKIWKKMGEWEGNDYSLGKLTLNKDGTGIMTLKGESRDITWNDKAIILSEEPNTYVLEDSKLTIGDDPTLVFVAKKNTWIAICILLAMSYLIFMNHNKNRIRLRNFLIVAGGAMIGFAIVNPKITTNQQATELQKSFQTEKGDAVPVKTETETTLTALPNETFPTAKYVQTNGLNARSGPG